MSVGRSVGWKGEQVGTKRRQKNKKKSIAKLIQKKKRPNSLSGVELDECGKGRNNQVTIQLKKKKKKKNH